MQTTITKEDVVGISPSFQKDFTDRQVQLAITSACTRSLGDGLDKPYNVNDPVQAQAVYDSGVLNYAQHLLALQVFMKYNGVTAATTMNNSQTITDKTNDDPYLAEYNRLVNLYGTSMAEKGEVLFYD